MIGFPSSQYALTSSAVLNLTPTERHDTYPAIDLSKADLSGKVVLVTGSSKGVGKAVAIAVAQAGASGLILFARSDLSSTKEACLSAKRAGKSLDVITCSVDITDKKQVETAVKKAEDVFGRLDVVINNAAQLNEYKTIVDSDVDDWWGIWDTNLKGTYIVTRAVLPLLIKSNGDKTIINVTSLGAAIVAPAMSSYCVRAKYHIVASSPKPRPA